MTLVGWSCGSQPLTCSGFVVEYLQLSVQKHLRQQCRPRDPFSLAQNGDAANVMPVLASEADVFDDRVERIVNHVAEIDQQVHLSLAVELLNHFIFESLVVGERELAEHAYHGEFAFVLNGDHDEQSHAQASRASLLASSAWRSCPGHALHELH